MPNLARRVDAVRRDERTSVPDAPIDYSVPYKTRVKGASRHFGFLPFFAKKPWPVVQEYINHYTSSGDLVCDPFSGSGVTAVESLVLGRRAAASDINPVALFITRMTAVAPVDINKLRAAYEQVDLMVRERIEALVTMPDAEVLSLVSGLDYPRVPIPSTVRRAGADTVDQLHTPRQLAGLTILRDAINQVRDPLLRDLLRIALANTVRYTNRTYSLPAAEAGKKRRSPYRGNAGFLRRFSFSLASEGQFFEHSVWETFERAFKNVVEAKEETNHIIGRRFNEENFILGQAPASKIHEITGEGVVDYCFTDPPYSNDIHFVDLSVLWAAWLGLEITEDVRASELLMRGSDEGNRRKFEQEFEDSAESISRSLKQDRWFTLVYKHRDLSLWQTIVGACEKHGLRYVNSVWQDIKIPSTRQIESPNINPKGDMYLNFRKMSPQRFISVYPRATVLDLPTRTTYIEKEIERLIVSYLGADIKMITSGVIQQILDSRAFRNYRENPVALTQDIQDILASGRFTTWSPSNGTVFWLLDREAEIETSLPTIDRARYYVFQFLHEKGEATEGEISAYLLTRFSKTPDAAVKAVDARKLLYHVGVEISKRRWKFDAKRVTRYQQLRLFFERSRADEILERVEERESPKQPPLRPDFEGITTLLDRLRGANADNSQFESQISLLLDVLNTMLHRLADYREDLVEQVRAVGEWAQEGIDLRNTPFENILVHIVIRSEDRPFELYQEIAQRVFSNLNDDEILLQFHLVTLPEWRHAVSTAQLRGREDTLGVPLLTRV
jgi:DNA modification methylase